MWRISSGAGYQICRQKAFRSLCLILAVVVQAPLAAQLPKVTAQVPDGHVTIGSAPGGKYVVARPLKKKYDELRLRVTALSDRIAAGNIDEKEARGELKKLKVELRDTLKQIEDSKRLVSVAKIHTLKVTRRIDLGREQMLLIQTGKVRVVGWEKDHVECVLEKTVLAVGDEDVKAHLDGIKLKHTHGDASGVIGQPKAELLKSMSKEGKELGEFQKKFVFDYAEGYRPFWAMQGKPVDRVEVLGLTFQQGNRQIDIELKSQEGRTSSSEWRRHARLTVFVPKCKVLAVKGGGEGVEIEGVKGDVAVLGTGDQDYNIRSRIRNISGSVIVHHAAIHDVSNVSGSVDIKRTAFRQNATTSYGASGRSTNAGSVQRYSYRSIGGPLTVWVCRQELHVQGANKRIDIRNDFGDTTVILDGRVADQPHRVLSESGTVIVRLPRKRAVKLKVLVLTESGIASTNDAGRALESKNITSPTGPDRTRRSWKGFVSKSMSFFDFTSRVDAVFAGSERPAGVDAISRAGRVRVELTQ